MCRAHGRFARNIRKSSRFEASDLAQCGANALDAAAKTDYIGPLVGAVARLKNGEYLKARHDLVKLRKSERFKEHARVMIEEIDKAIRTAERDEQLADEMVARIPGMLAKRILDDVFEAENKAVLLERVRQLPFLFKGEEPLVPVEAPAADETAREPTPVPPTDPGVKP